VHCRAPNQGGPGIGKSSSSLPQTQGLCKLSPSTFFPPLIASKSEGGGSDDDGAVTPARSRGKREKDLGAGGGLCWGLKASSLAGAGLGATAEEWAELRERLLKKDRRMRKDIELLEAEGEPGRELMELMKVVSADVRAFLEANQARWP
jgi:hypothetical protein